MDQDPINSWLSKAAEMKHAAESAPTGVNVIARKHRPVNQGNVIVDLAEKLRPILMKRYKDVRDENQQMVQPARIRALSLNLAQKLVKEYQS
jgi:hypothetical protein